jgi:serine/threonine protein kinase
MRALHRISLARFDKVRSLGMTQYGKTYLAQDKTTQSQYAVKTFPDCALDPESLTHHLERLVSVTHIALLPIIGYSLPNRTKNRPLAVSSPFLADGSLAMLVASGRGLSNNAKQKILFGVAEGLRYLHGQGIAHSALTPHNIVLTTSLEPRACDFGFDELRPSRPLFNRTEKGFAFDSFCYGLLVYSLLSGDLFHGDVLPPVPDTMPDRFRSLIWECWDPDPGKRPTFDHIVLRFLHGDLSLPVEDPVEVEGYQSKTIAAEFANRSLIGVLRQLRSVTDANQQLTEDVRKLERNMDFLMATVQRLSGSSAETSTESSRKSGVPPIGLASQLKRYSQPADDSPINSSRVTWSRPASSGRLQAPARRIATPPIAITEHNSFAPTRTTPPPAVEHKTRRWIDPGTAHSIVPIDLPPGAEFPYESDAFAGIFANFTARVNGNIAELGIIKLTGNSIDEARDLDLPGVVDFTWTKCWTSKNEPSSWIEFNFLHREIFITHYSIKTYSSPRGFSHMRFWQLLGKTAAGPWSALDARDDNDDLNGKWHYATYVCTTPSAAQFVKLVQTGPNHHGDNYLHITNMEFFGVVA